MRAAGEGCIDGDLVWEDERGEIGVLDGGCWCSSGRLEGHRDGRASRGRAGWGRGAGEKPRTGIGGRSRGRRSVRERGRESILLSTFRTPRLASGGTRRDTVGSQLGGLFVFSVHGHALAWQDVGQSTLVTKLAVAFDEPSTDVLVLTGLMDGVREGAR